MPVFDLVGFFTLVKSIALQVFSLSIVVSLQLFTWTFVISSFLLAGTIIVKFYNWFSMFKTYFDNSSSSTILNVAKASGVVSALSDVYSFFLLVFTVFISYKASIYLYKFADKALIEVKSVASLINSR